MIFYGGGNMQFDCPAGIFKKINKGENLATISENNSMTSESLLNANAFLNPTYYLTGQVIVIPYDEKSVKGIYRVKEGETLYDILRKSNTSAAELISLNPNLDIFNLKCNDELNIPLKQIKCGEYYTIQENEDLISLSKKLGITQLELLRLNPNLKMCIRDRYCQARQ